MTDPTAANPPAPAVPEAPAKKGGAGRIIGIVIAVLLVGGGLLYNFVIAPAIENAKWKVGACIDIAPVSEVTVQVDPKIVDCSSSEAKSEIIAVFEGSNLDDAEAKCTQPNATGAIQNEDGTTLYCLANK
jgi:hypothetical protein